MNGCAVSISDTKTFDFSQKIVFNGILEKKCVFLPQKESDLISWGKVHTAGARGVKPVDFFEQK